MILAFSVTTSWCCSSKRRRWMCLVSNLEGQVPNDVLVERVQFAPGGVQLVRTRFVRNDSGEHQGTKAFEPHAQLAQIFKSRRGIRLDCGGERVESY